MVSRRESDLSTVAVCDENIGHSDVLVSSQFFRRSRILDLSGSLLEVILGGFGYLWAVFWLFLRVLETGLKFDDFSGVPWGSPG